MSSFSFAIDDSNDSLTYRASCHGVCLFYIEEMMSRNIFRSLQLRIEYRKQRLSALSVKNISSSDPFYTPTFSRTLITANNMDASLSNVTQYGFTFYFGNRRDRIKSAAIIDCRSDITTVAKCQQLELVWSRCWWWHSSSVLKRKLLVSFCTFFYCHNDFVSWIQKTCTRSIARSSEKELPSNELAV